MSNEAITWAFKQDLPTTQKFVLVALADYADEAGECFPSHNKTAERVGASRSTVRRAIKQLTEQGYLTYVREQRKDGTFTSNRYSLNLSRGWGQSDPRGVPTVNQGRATSEPWWGHSEPTLGSPVNQQEPPVNPQRTITAHEHEQAPDPFDDFWEVYPRKKEKKRAQAAWKSAVKREPAEGIIAAAKNYAEERKNVKDGEQFTKHASTWLNNDCWEDYRTSTVKASPVFWADAL